MPTVEQLQASDVIPIDRIEAIIGRPLEHSRRVGAELRIQDPTDFNQAIERSIMRVVLSQEVQFPERFADIRREPSLYDAACRHILRHKLGSPPPATQVYFQGSIEQGDCYILHLADTLESELYISDIYLCNPLIDGAAEHTSIGHGIFDEILRRIEAFARANGYARLGLSAYRERNMRSFAKRGFVVEDNMYGDVAQEVGMGYPMIKSIS